jgi:ketosteroid isomerase-like protein
MSQENVEIVNRAYEAMNDREFSRMPEFLDPDVEFDLSRNILNPDVYRGYAGFEPLVGVIEDVWDDFRFEVQELIDAGDRVVADVTVSGKGRVAASRRTCRCSTSGRCGMARCCASQAATGQEPTPSKPPGFRSRRCRRRPSRRGLFRRQWTKPTPKSGGGYRVWPSPRCEILRGV